MIRISLPEESLNSAYLEQHNADFIRLLRWEIPLDGWMEYQFGEHNTNIVDYALLDDGVSKVSSKRNRQEQH